VPGAAFLQENHPQQLNAETGCQFTANFAWYSFVPSNSENYGEVYSSTDAATAAEAYFTYCYKKQPTACTSTKSSYAQIKVSGQDACALQATDITGTTVTEDDETIFALKYTNTNSDTNGGVSDLIVKQTCVENQANVVTSALTTDNDGQYVTT
jgi:hypothetical protein